TCAHANAYAHTDGDLHAYAYTNGDSHAYAYAYSDSHADTDSDGHSHADAYADGYSHTYSYTDSHSYADANGYVHTDAYTNGYSHTDTYADGYSHTYSYTDPNTGAHFKAQPDTKASTHSTAASVGLVLKELVTRFRGAQAASLLSSAACRRLPTPCKNHTQRTFNELFGRLPKRTGSPRRIRPVADWQPVLPGSSATLSGCEAFRSLDRP